MARPGCESDSISALIDLLSDLIDLLSTLIDLLRALIDLLGDAPHLVERLDAKVVVSVRAVAIDADVRLVSLLPHEGNRVNQ
jgi:hypothetical protein